MDKDAFLATEDGGWWLLQSDLPDVLDQKRVELGVVLGWTDPRWYAEPAKVAELHELLERTNPQLLVDLDQATDAAMQQQWLEALVLALGRHYGAGDALGVEAGSPPAAAATVSPESTTTGAPPPPPPPPPPQAPKASLFAKKPAAAGSEMSAANAVVQTPESTAPGAADGSGDGDARSQPAEPTKKSIFGKRAAADGDRPAGATSPAAEEEVGGDEPDAVALAEPEAVALADEVLAGLPPEDLDAIARQAGFEGSAEMLNDSEFMHLLYREAQQVLSAPAQPTAP